MVMRRSIKLMLFLFLSLSSCIYSNSHINPIITTAVIASPTSLPFSTVETPVPQGSDKTGEATLESPVPTPSIISSVEQPLNAFTLPCQGISTISHDHLGISGNLLAVDENGFFIFDLNNGKNTRVLEDASVASMHNVFISPNGDSIAYIVYQKSTRVIWLVVEPVGNLLQNDASQQTQWGKGTDFQMEGWFTNQTLLITREKTPDSFSSTLIVNPFNREEKEYFLEDLPNFKYFKSGGVGLYHFTNSNLMPDPTLRLVVYPEWLNGHDYISLWDVETTRTLARIDDQYAYTGNPLWAQDGSNFLMMASTIHTNARTIFDWFQVGCDGNTRQITHFADLFENNSISNASRSLDGHYLAFKMKTDRVSEEKNRYYILDLQTDPLVLFCVDAMETPSSITEKQPVWSPDSRYVVISNTDENNHGPLLLVDLAERRVYEISKDSNARGWMVKP